MNQFQEMFSKLPSSDYPDLKYRSSESIRNSLTTIFSELPEKFDSKYKNPCWVIDQGNSKYATKQQYEKKKSKDKKSKKIRSLDVAEIESELEGVDNELLNGLTCLPYFYILGQPKSGTSDLWNRLIKHPNIIPPSKKEIRWFTRGEFVTTFKKSDVIDETTSIYDFTSKFSSAIKDILKDPKNSITLDGGPHTLWWPTQGADGILRPNDIPPAQLLHEIQPNAKFLITLSNPIHRMYSDYYFLNDDRKVAKHPPSIKSNKNEEYNYVIKSTKSPFQFHERVVNQVNEFHECIENILQEKQVYSKLLPNISNFTNYITNILKNSFNSQTKITSSLIINEWFRASQVCAHDRHKFGVAGYGRISIGLYILYIEKWLESFNSSQFLILRLENYEKNPRNYMTQIFKFLDIQLPTDEKVWEEILTGHIANQHNYDREEMYIETEEILQEFYHPYNLLLAKLLNNRDFLWDNTDEYSDLNIPKLHLPINNPEQNNNHNHQLDLQDHVDNKEGYKNLPPHVHDDPSLLEKSESGINELDKIIEKQKMKSLPIPKNNLRGNNPSKNTEPQKVIDYIIKLKPKSFSLDNLTIPLENITMNEFVKNVINEPLPMKLSASNAFDMLCTATLGMDIVALKYLLYDYGIPGNIKDLTTSASLFHCLGSVGIFGEAVSKSYIFPMLKGKKTWLTELFDPPLPILSHSIHALDIKKSLSKSINTTFYWLLLSGVNVNSIDILGQTPLHVACTMGLENLVELLLIHGANPNSLSKQNKSPLHYAIAYGYSSIGSLLVRYGGNLELEDIHGVKPIDIILNNGVISSNDALKYFSITQKPIRTIERYIHPELNISLWKGGTGNYNIERLKGYENNMECDVDQYWASEITGKEIFQNYFARNRPILIRGLIDDWLAIEKYKLNVLLEEHGEEIVQVSSIPYSNKFGGDGVIDKKLSEYINEMINHNMTGGNHPWYVFKGHPIKESRTQKNNSLVNTKIVPTPMLISESLHYVNMGPNYDSKIKLSTKEIQEYGETRKDFINAQWALGGRGTGAPVHYHNTAWNALLYGAKKWILYPPSHMIMSNKQILEYIEDDLEIYKQKGIHYATCIQTAGDILIVPESWGHGVLNIQDSVAVATESKGSIWRLSVKLDAVKHLPDDNRKAYTK